MRKRAFGLAGLLLTAASAAGQESPKVAGDAWPASWGAAPAPPGWDRVYQPKTSEWKKHPQILRFNNGAEIEGLDPAVVTGVPEHRILMAVYEGITMYDPVTSEPRPGTAESWTVSDGGRSYEFKIRPNAKWSNGDPVTAADYRYSWWRVLAPQPPSQYAYMLFDIENAKAFAEGRIAETELPLYWDPACAQPTGRKLAVGDICEILWTFPDPIPETASEEQLGTIALLVKCGDKKGWVKRQALRGTWRLDGPAFAKVGIKVKDERTLLLRLSEAKPFFLEILSHETSFPVHRPTVEKHGNDDAFRKQNFVGNGPYVLADWQPRVKIVLKKSPTYWDRDRVKLETIEAQPVESIETAYSMYKGDECDWLITVPLSKIDEVKLDPDYYVAPYLGVYFYRFNCKVRPVSKDDPRPHPLSEKRVRRALNLAVNKKDICEKITKGGQIPATGYVPPSTAPWYEPFEGLAYDREKARALLAAAGFPGGQGFPKIEILYNTLESHKNIAEAVAGMWKDNLGITVGLANTEWKVYLDQVDQVNYDIARAGWIGDYLDPNTFLDMWVTGGGNNNTGWSHAEYDKLIAEAAAASNQSVRKAAFRRAETILCTDEFPILPIYYYVNQGMKKPKLQGVHLNIKDMHPWQYLWIEPEE